MAASAGLISKVRGADAKAKAEKKKNGGFDSYEIDDAVRTLQQAAKIMSNKKLMAICAERSAEAHKHIKKMTRGAAKADPAALDEELE